MTEQGDPESSVLRTTDLSKHFGGLTAVDNVSMAVSEGEILSVIGPNGAGKTTLFNLITGVHTPSAGSVELLRGDGNWKDITGKSPHAVAELGLVRTFQNARPFHDLTVLENILAGMGLDEYRSLRMFSRFDGQTEIEEATQILERVGLDGHEAAFGSDLPLALQRRLEIGRALALEPHILLLDEPAAGLNDEENRALIQQLEKIRDSDTTIVLIEHTMDVVMRISDRIVVLDQGAVIAEGAPSDVREDERVREAYLGKENDDETKPTEQNRA